MVSLLSRVFGKRPGAEILVLGTSNAIGPGSYADHLSRRMGPLQNLSIGASASTVGLYQSAVIRPVRNGFALLDYTINDNDAGANLWGPARAHAVFLSTFRTLAAMVGVAGYFPLVLMLPSDLAYVDNFFGERVHLDTVRALGLNFLNVRALFLKAISAGTPKAALMRDEWHMSEAASGLLAGHLAGVIATLGRAAPVSAARRERIPAIRIVRAPSLFAADELIHLSSSLRAAPYGVLTPGRRIELALAEGERLAAMMLNAGAHGGHLLIRGERDVVKNAGFEWAGHDPKLFFSVLADIAEPLAGADGSVTIELTGDDLAPTEPTIHGRSLKPGLPRAVEIEAALITGPERDVDYVGRSYPGLPLDLGELAETERLYRALRKLGR